METDNTMTVLSDRAIKREMLSANLKIDPFEESQLQAASYDLTLDNTFLLPKRGKIVDPFEKQELFDKVIVNTNVYMPHNAFLLASTKEVIKIPTNMIGRVEGKSSLGRLGLIIHQTAGFIDPGFEGNITLEITNSFPEVITLYPGMLIAQIAFEFLDTSCLRPYNTTSLNSKYQYQSGPQEPRYYLNKRPSPSE